MSKIFFTSDTHFDHGFVADLRGFDSTREHDEWVVDQWNSRVGKRDVVWHLGDVGIGNLSRFEGSLTRLNGTIHLITGNHDECAPGIFRNAHTKQAKWLDEFASIQQFARFKVGDLQFLASHFPFNGEGKRDTPDRFSEFRLRDEGIPLVHGHTHDGDQRLSRSVESSRMFHVGWDAHHAPVDRDEIVEAFS